MSNQIPAPRPARSFLHPAAHHVEGLTVGTCVAQALGLVAVLVLGLGPALALIVGAVVSA